MKLMLIALLAILSLSQLCTSLDDDYQEPPATAGESEDGVPESDASRGKVNEGGHDDTYGHDPTLDQDALVGGEGARKRLTELPKEEAEKEIRELVERIDTNSDGLLDREELLAWLRKVEDKAYTDEAAILFSKEDPDGDGYVTLEEYIANSGLPVDVPEDAKDSKTEEGIRKRFEITDKDKDGRLSETEFSMFVHPDRHEAMLGHLVQEQLNRLDSDGDRRVSFDEYMKHYNPSGKPTDEMPEWLEGEIREFKEKLDANKDGYLDDNELIKWILPNDEEIFNEEVDHLINHMDENKDNKLSVEEVLAQFDVVVDSLLTDYGHAVHEEL